MSPGRDDAVAALRRIAFLLEQAQADRYRAAAFRSAAATLELQDAEEVASAARSGALTDLPGIGQRTAGVVADVLAGRPVGYLDDLEAAVDTAPLPPAAELVARALRGDLHTHTDASDGRAPMQEMVLAAVQLGHEYLAVTDHSPRLRVANGLSADRLRAQVAGIGALNRAVSPFRVLTGIEVDILADGTLDQRPELLEQLDVVVASVHSAIAMEPAAMTRRLLRAVADPHTDVLGHPSNRKVAGARTRPASTYDVGAVVAACAEYGVAVEINCAPDRLDPPDDLLAAAVATGCLVSIDTDAHAPGELAWQRSGAVRAAHHGLPPERILDTWDADGVVAHSHR